MYMGLHVKYPLFLLGFDETLIFFTYFRKASYKYHENTLCRGEFFHVD